MNNPAIVHTWFKFTVGVPTPALTQRGFLRLLFTDLKKKTSFRYKIPGKTCRLMFICL